MLSIFAACDMLGDWVPYGMAPVAGAVAGPLRRPAPFLGVPASGERTEKGLKGSDEGEKADAGCDVRGRLPFVGGA